MSSKEFNEEDLFDEDIFGDLDFDSAPGSQPPKGIKGYFKNVAKSGKNIAIGFGNQLMPGTTETVRGIAEAVGLVKDAFTDRKDKLMKKMSQKKSDPEGVVGALKKNIKDTVEDWKNRIKTGEFVKGEDDIDMNAMMGGDDDEEGEEEGGTWYDAVFGSDDSSSSYYDSSSSQEQEDLNMSDAGGEPAGGVALPPMKNIVKKNIIKKTTIRGADTSVLAQIQGNSTIALINAFNAANEQLLIAEEAHHREKMMLMTNIQKNVFKSASFMGGLYKMTAEFDRKLMKGLIDIHSMLKERREMDIEIYKHEQDIWTDNRATTADVFGGGFNADSWVGAIGRNLKEAFDMSAVGQLYQANSMLADMGKMTGQKQNLVSMLLNPFALISNNLIGSNIRSGLNRLDRNLTGLPAIMNNFLAGLSEKGGILGKIGEIFSIKDSDSYVDMSKYAVRDLKRPTAWDMAARQSLVEVIPGFLAKIEANTSKSGKELYYDHNDKSFKTIESLHKRYKMDRKMALSNNNFEFGDAVETMRSNVYEQLSQAGVKMSNAQYDAMFDKLIDNMAMQQKIFNTDTARNDEYYRNNLMANMGGSDEAKKAILDTFIGIMMNPESAGLAGHEIAGFQSGLAVAKGNIARMHKDYGYYGGEDDYKLSALSRAIGSDPYVNTLNNSIAMLEAKLAKDPDNISLRTRYQELITQRNRQLEISGSETTENYSMYEGKTSSERELMDIVSGKGNVAQRIYELLLEGVTVFPDEMDKATRARRSKLLDEMSMNRVRKSMQVRANEEALKKGYDESFRTRKDNAKRLRELRSGSGFGNLTGLSSFGPFAALNRFIGDAIDFMNDFGEEKLNIKFDSQRYGGNISKESLKKQDKNYQDIIDNIDKYSNDDTTLGRIMGWFGKKARQIDEKRRDYNDAHFTDDAHSEGAFGKIVNWAKKKYNTYQDNKNRKDKALNEEELIVGEDVPMKIKPPKGINFNGVVILMVTKEDFEKVKPLLKRFHLSYVSAENGVSNLNNIKCAFISEKFAYNKNYSNFIDTFDEFMKTKEGRNFFYFTRIGDSSDPHSLVYFLEHEPKIFMNNSLNADVIREINESTAASFEADEIFASTGSSSSTSKKNKKGLFDKFKKDKDTQVKSEHRVVGGSLDIEKTFLSNMRGFETKLDRIIELMERSGKYSGDGVEVKNMEEVVTLLGIISNNGGGGGGVNIKEIEKAFDRQRKKGKGDSFLMKAIKAPFKVAGWGIKTGVKGLGFGLSLPFLLAGGALGGILGGTGLAIRGGLFGARMAGKGIAGIGKGLWGLGKAGVKVGKVVGGSIWNGTKWIVGNGLKAGTVVAGKIWDGAKWVGRKGWNALKWAGGKIKDAAGWVKDKVVGAGKWVRDKVTGGWKWVKDKASMVGATLKDTIRNGIARGGELLGKAGGAIKKGIGAVGKVLAGGAAAILSPFTGLMYNKAMLQNLVQIRMMLEKEYGPIDPQILKTTMEQYSKSPQILSRVSSAMMTLSGNFIKKSKDFGDKMMLKYISAREKVFGIGDAIKNKVGGAVTGVKKKLAGFFDRGDGSGIREGSVADIRKDKEEAEAKRMTEEMHAASLVTAAATTALLEKDFGGKDGKNGQNGPGTLLSMGIGTMLAGFGTKVKSFVKNIFRSKGGGKTFIGKGIQKVRIGAKKVWYGAIRGAKNVGKTILKGAKNFGKSIISKGAKFGSKVGTFLSKSGSIGTKVANAAKGVGQVFTKFGKWMASLFTKLFGKGGKLAAKVGPKASKILSTKLPQMLLSGMKNLPGAGAKIASKAGAKIGLTATGIGAIAVAAADIIFGTIAFVKNYKRAGELLGVPPGQEVTKEMRIIAGVVGAIDSVLVGLPSLILGMDTLVKLIYNALKGSMPSEDEWRKKRAEAYGVMKQFANFNEYCPDPSYKKDWKQRLGSAAFKASGVGLVVNAFKTFKGLNKASFLGFKSSKVFKTWKDKRFEPLQRLEEQVLESLGGKKAVQNDEELREKYKEQFLKVAKEYVTSNKLEKLNSEAEEQEKEKKGLSVQGAALGAAGVAGAAALGIANTPESAMMAGMSGGIGTAPNADAGQSAIEGQAVKKGIFSQAMSFLSKNKKNLLLMGLLGPGALLFKKGAEVAWGLLKKGASWVKDKVSAAWNYVTGNIAPAASKGVLEIQDKVADMIRGVLEDAAGVPDSFRLAFDIIKSYISRMIGNGLDKAYSDDTIQYGLSYNKHRQLLKDKFGINSPEEMHNLTMSAAVWIYYSEYYNKSGKLSELTKNDKILAYHYFHHMMDTSKDVADSMMKEVEKIPDASLRSHAFVQMRLNYYRKRAKEDPNQRIYLAIWERNVFSLNKELGFVFKEGLSYGADIDEMTKDMNATFGPVGSGNSPDANGGNYASYGEPSGSDTSVGMGYNPQNDNSETEDMGTGSGAGPSAGGGLGGGVSSSTAFGSSGDASNPLVSGANVSSGSLSMDFKSLKEFIEKELELLNNIKDNTASTAIGVNNVQGILVAGFENIIKALSGGRNGSSFSIGEQQAEGSF